MLFLCIVFGGMAAVAIGAFVLAGRLDPEEQ
jgi:hypothetical protein